VTPALESLHSHGISDARPLPFAWGTVLALPILFRIAFQPIKFLQRLAAPKLFRVLCDLWPEGRIAFIDVLTLYRFGAIERQAAGTALLEILRTLETARVLGKDASVDDLIQDWNSASPASSARVK